MMHVPKTAMLSLLLVTSLSCSESPTEPAGGGSSSGADAEIVVSATRPCADIIRADVLIDNRHAGVLGIPGQLRVTVQPGRYRVSLRGFPSAVTFVDVAANQRMPVSLSPCS